MPSLDSPDGLKRYVAEARRLPLLEASEEAMLARRFRDSGDTGAAQRLVASHQRLVVRQAYALRGYGLPLSDLIAEGNVGLMQALQRFEPERDLRFSTYAMWWVKATMMEYVLKHSAPVSFGLSAERKRLFFRLKEERRRLGEAAQSGPLAPEHTAEIARRLDVRPERVTEMEQVMAAPPRSLSEPVSEDGTPLQDLLADSAPLPETVLAERQERAERRRLLSKAWTALNERERSILAGRRLRETPLRLEDLARRYNISRERVRQIEKAAVEKLKRLMGVGQPALA